MSPDWGEWLLERAGDGLPYPDEYEGKPYEPMPDEGEETEEDE